MTAKKNGRKRRPAAFQVKPTKRSNSFAKLRALDCFDEVHRLLVSGWTPKKVAEFIQEERHEYTDVSLISLASTLQRYRATIPSAEMVKSRMPECFESAAQRVSEGLNELEELWLLYGIQMERVAIEYENERTIRKLFPSMTQEVRAAREILTSIAQLKMDLGLNERQLGRLDVEAHITAHVEERLGDPKVAKVLSNPEKRRKLLGLASKLARVADGPEVIEAVAEVSDGEPVGAGC